MSYFPLHIGKAPVFRGNWLETQVSSKRPDRISATRGTAGQARPATEPYLERAAVHYLARFACSVGHFKAVLWRKVRRRGLPEDVSDADAQRWIDALAGRFTDLGLLDDGSFADGRARSLHRRGRPLKVIERDLKAKGLSAEDAARAVEALREDSPDADRDAARSFARRKRLGPFHQGEADADRRRKELAAMARAGFSYDAAREVLQADPDDGIW